MAMPSKGGPSSGEAAGAARFGSGSGSSSGGPGTVYMGEAKYGVPKGISPQARRMIREQNRRGIGSRFLSKEEAELDFYTWSAKKQMDFLSKSMLAGLLKFGDGPMEASKLWRKLVKEAAFYGETGAKVSPMDILSTYVHGAGDGKGVWVKQGDFEVNSVTGEKRYIGPQFKTTTAQRIDLTDPATARAIATKIFQDLMGRNPGKGEIGTFASALASAERDNPLMETTTTEYDMATGEPVGSKSVTQGGVTADAKALLAEDQVKADPEFGAVQAATTYMNALENAVYGAPG